MKIWPSTGDCALAAERVPQKAAVVKRLVVVLVVVSMRQIDVVPAVLFAAVP